MLLIRLESTVDVMIAVSNARPENFRPEFFSAVQIYYFPVHCTWALRICNEELVPLEIFNSDWHRPYDVTEKIQFDYRERFCTLKEIRFLLLGSLGNHDDDGNKNVTNLHI